MESGRVFRHRFTCIALLTMLFCSCGRSQKPGFLSIDCGSDRASIYTDSNGIEWVSDSNLINVGTSRAVTGGTDPLLATIRLFEGNQSKYCYSLSNSAVVTGAFFLVRASIWAGIAPPYTPKNADGYIRFKMIVDANEWTYVKVPFGTERTTWWTYDMYTRAQRNSIDVCFGRSTPDGDAPFISALELRPLPSTLTAAYLMNGTNTNFVCLGHNDYGVPSSGDTYTRYPYDVLDRIWISQKASEATDEVNITTLAIDVTKQVDEPPSTILQNSFMGGPYITLSYSDLNPESKYVAEFYFAEIDPAVNASGMRTFSIYANGDPVTSASGEPIDVFAAVGAYTAYNYLALASPNSTGDITFNFIPTATSVFPPFLAAAELFEVNIVTNLTAASIVNAVEDIKVHLRLSSYTGDPCLPSGYGYPWLNCSGDVGITTILLSNYGTSGEIPGAINLLPTLIEVYLDGNNLRGEIPDLSALVNLEALHLNNNRLSGPIPDFLATLKNLKVLYLQNNNLSGEIPAALLQRKQASQLKFEFSGNPLCESNNAECGPSPSSLIGPSTVSKKSSTGAIIGGAVAGILLVVIVIVSAAHYCLRRPKEPQGVPQDSPVQNKVIPKLSIQEFSFQEINNATNNFHTPLGQGGFGSVYKGCLQDGRFVAIKVASNFSHQGPREFLNEVDLLSRVHHKNLVALLGFCNAERLVLVYEFMPNGSLDDCLHGPYSRISPLPWRMRLRILIDAAQGIDYLHNGCNPPIIHRDVKSSNILLNDKMEAKISDFGISRDYIRDETGALPTVVMGSRGYMDPEYVSSMNLTQKVDIYSFGVLLFEVVCGRKAILKDPSHQQMNIVEWAKGLIDNGVIDDIVDVSLHGQYNPLSVRKVVEVGLACVEIPSSKRPKIGEVYLELTEAERMELGSDERSTIDQTPVEFTSDERTDSMEFANSGISFDTEVSAR